MIPSIALVVTVLSLISCSRAATIHARQDGCTFVCPDKDVEGNDLSSLATDDGVISCSYFGDSFNWCTYDSTSGALLGDGDCPQRAVQQCNTRRSPVLKQAVARRGDSDEPTWKTDDSPTSTPVWPPYAPPPSWSPSPSKPKPSPPPSTPKPCKFKCPQKDLAKNPLTDEAIREPFLFCSFSTSHCKSCSFCKYSTKTGLLLEDNDDGNCPKTASASRPWDRRYA